MALPRVCCPCRRHQKAEQYLSVSLQTKYQSQPGSHLGLLRLLDGTFLRLQKVHSPYAWPRAEKDV